MSKRIVIVSILLFLISCLQISLKSAVEPKYIKFEEKLLGTWVDGEKSIYQVLKGDSNNYQISYRTKKSIGEFKGTLFSIKKEIFVELLPKKIHSEEYDQFLYWPVHGYFHLEEKSSDSLYIRMFNPDWVEEYLSKNKDAIEHYRVDDAIILTAGSNDLRDFIIKCYGIPEAFGDKVLLVKMNDKVKTPEG